MASSPYDPPPSYSAINSSPVGSPRAIAYPRPARIRWPNSDTPLVPAGKGDANTHRRRLYLTLWCIGAIVFAVFIGQNAGLVRCPLNDVTAAEKAALREQWRVESEMWARERAKFAEEAAAWERASEEHRKELEEWQRQREEEERHRLELKRRSQGVWWTEPYGDAHCHAYGTRTYYAYLRDIPGDLNWLEVCYNMPPVSIHGHNMSQPDKCEPNGHGEIVGTWYVSSGEPSCVSRWGWFDDRGCAHGKPGYRRYEAPIQGVGDGDDRRMMCATTPAVVRGVQYDGAGSCETRGLWPWPKYTVGIWDVPDRWC